MNDGHATATVGSMSEVGSRTDKAWPGDDFPSWLPPMLVRELRQGIQSGAFFWTFLLMQLALFILAAFTLLAASEQPGRTMPRGVDGFLWAILGITVGLVIPLRGMAAIASERVGNNLDLVRLTRLSATRIVAGKWAAIVAQALLVAVAALPYLVLHYFFGGVNVLADLARFGWLLVLSALVAAFAVLASTRPQRERVALMLAVGVGAWMTLVASLATMSPVFGFSTGWLWVCVPVFYTALFLEAAAASIAPPAENHALRKRLVGIVSATLIAWVGFSGSAPQFGVVIAIFGPPLLLISLGALLERPVRIRRLHTAFARGGVAGRLAAAIFTPGWATGLVFVGLIGVLVAGGVLAQASTAGHYPYSASIVSLFAATIIFPLPVLLLFPKVEAKGTLYGAIQMLCLVPWGVDAILSEMPGSLDPGVSAIVLPFPIAGLLRVVGSRQGDPACFLAGCFAVVLVMALVARPWYREMVETQQLVGGEAAP